jgi:hypothetical protein
MMIVILMIEAYKMHYFSNLFWYIELHIFRTDLLSIIMIMDSKICRVLYTKINLRNSASCWLLL